MREVHDLHPRLTAEPRIILSPSCRVTIYYPIESRWALESAVEFTLPFDLAAISLELLGRDITERAVSALAVVFDAPVLDHFARMRDAAEPVLIQALVPELAAEAFDVRVAVRLAGSDKRVPGSTCRVGQRAKYERASCRCGQRSGHRRSDWSDAACGVSPFSEQGSSVACGDDVARTPSRRDPSERRDSRRIGVDRSAACVQRAPAHGGTTSGIGQDRLLRSPAPANFQP